jgi:hypothetical protein
LSLGHNRKGAIPDGKEESQEEEDGQDVRRLLIMKPSPPDEVMASLFGNGFVYLEVS